MRLIGIGTGMGLSVLLACVVSSASAETPVHLHIAVAPRGPVDAATRWLETLKPIPFASLKLQSATTVLQPSIEEVGQGASLRLNVVGVVTARNELQLPGGTFRPGDRAAITAWLAKIRGQRSRGSEPRGEFGLTDREQRELTDQLSRPVDLLTRDRPTVEVLGQLQRLSRVPIDIAPEAVATTLSDTPVRDELSGVSQGTAMAALLRPLGLVLVPSRSEAGESQLRIEAAKDIPSAWPVGRPTQQPPPKVHPKLFELLPVEIREIPLERALAALQTRLEIPFLIDYQQVAAQQIDLRQKVSLEASKASYHRVLSQLLFQAKLKMELRVDDAQRPFLWIAPLKPSRVR